jgi:hypothetical protein
VKRIRFIIPKLGSVSLSHNVRGGSALRLYLTVACHPSKASGGAYTSISLWLIFETLIHYLSGSSFKEAKGR